MSGMHTAGPWQQYHADHEPLRIVGNVDGEIIEGSTHYTYDNIVEEVEGQTAEIALANARLIAAAPELLTELVALRRRFHAACLATGSDPDMVEGCTPGTDAAIAKATGK